MSGFRVGSGSSQQVCTGGPVGLIFRDAGIYGHFFERFESDGGAVQF
jgi:hypothetical protein